jgi:hypothetical protein
MLTNMSNLALVLQAQGRYKEAETLMQQALGQARLAQGEDLSQGSFERVSDTETFEKDL